MITDEQTNEILSIRYKDDSDEYVVTSKTLLSVLADVNKYGYEDTLLRLNFIAQNSGSLTWDLLLMRKYKQIFEQSVNDEINKTSAVSSYCRKCKEINPHNIISYQSRAPDEPQTDKYVCLACGQVSEE